MRFTLCWNTAVILPISSVSALITATHNCQVACRVPNASSNSRTKPINTETFTMVAMKEVNTVGAPSYTSGVQKWKGAADTLNDMENKRRSIPATAGRSGDLVPMLISEVLNVPVEP